MCYINTCQIYISVFFFNNNYEERKPIMLCYQKKLHLYIYRPHTIYLLLRINLANYTIETIEEANKLMCYMLFFCRMNVLRQFVDENDNLVYAK